MEKYSGCILIPAYNEEKHISDLIQKIGGILPIIVVDDGSTDNTVKIATNAGTRVFRQEVNQGKGAALVRGFKEALRLGYDYVITLDADGQHDPAELYKFIDLYEKNKIDLIIGFRDFKQMPWVRRISNTMGTYAFSWAMGQKIQDNQSGYRLMSARLMDLVLDSSELGFHFEVEVIVRCLKAGYSLAWVPIRTIYADETSHIRPLQHLFHFSRMVLQTRKKMRS
ncbi:MAG: dolichol-phosphate mannose synthase [Anaerolineaceae bacterium]|nr:dolichol-phosphate mannose synthase [Anaerolineaceae bacterium]